MNLEPLYEEAIQFNNFNGTVLAAGKVEVWYLGRTRKADIYADVAGETPLPNPFDLNNLGMQQVYVNPAFNYTLVVYDPYGSELFSIDKYLQGAGVHTTSNVVVQPSENIGVSAWTVGEVQIYQPYLVGEVGKTYEGISPIVVNNDEDKISANHVALGLQEPLFFVQDDENACIIGCSAQTEIPSSVSSKWEDASDTVSNNSAQWGIGTVYTPGNYIDIQDDVISVTGLQPAGDYAYNSAVSSKLDTTAFSTVSGNFLTAVDLTPYQEKTAMTGYLTTGDSAQFYTNDNPSGFITGVDLSDYATTGDLANKLDTTAFSNVSGDFITALPEDLVYTGDLSDYAKKDFVNDSIDSATSGLLPTSSFSSVSGSFLTALPSDIVYTADITGKQDITGMTAYQPKSAMNIYLTNWAASITYQPTAGMTAYLTTADSANFYPTSNPSGFISEVPNTYLQNSDLGITDNKVTAISGILLSAGDELPESVSAATDCVTANSATWDSVTDKLDTTAFSDVSGNFLTAHQDLSDYQTISGMTAYQEAGNYYSASNPSGFITGIPDDLTLKSLNVKGIIESYESEQEGVNVSQTGIQLYNDIDGVEDVTIAAIRNWNSTYETVSTNSASWTATTIPDELTAAASAVSSNSATWDSVTDKLDTTAFSTVSSTFLTAHQDLSDYQTTAGMTAYQSAGDYLTTADSAQFITALPADLVYTADITGFATTADLTSKLDKSDSANFYTTANESGFITGIPSEVTNAASTVASNSANWNSTYNTVNANSADWSVSEEISGINGIKISESADKVIIEVSADYYLASNPSGFITGINYNTGSI